MAWQDNLREAAYTSPDGKRQAFTYEDVAQEFDRQTVAYNFPNGRGTFVQDLGTSSRRFPLRVIFWGDTCDEQAADFEKLLIEPGIGRLEHPLYGLRYVVPFGTVARRDDLKTAANQVIFDMVFFETVRSVYPSTNADPQTEVLEAVQAFNTATAAEFAASVDVQSAGNKARLKDTILSLKKSVTAGLQAVADTIDSVSATFNAIDQSINSGIDLLVGEPLDLAFQVVQLIQAPARSSAAISDRLAAYGNLLDFIVNGPNATTRNEFRSRDLYGAAYVTGSVVSSVYTNFTTKPKALEAVDALFAQFDELTAWRDAQFAARGLVDTGDTFQKLQEAVALLAGYLVGVSFNLKQERTLYADRDRTVVDLCAELYGELESLDFFIASNNFNGQELIELPRGTAVVYYL